MSKCLAKLQKCWLCTVHLFPFSKGSNYLCWSNILRRKNHTEVHSFLKQYFARSSAETVLGDFQLRSAEVGLKISWKYHQIVSNEDHTKHCFKNEWIWQCSHVRKWQINIVKTLLDKNKNAPSDRISSYCVQHSFRTF